MNGPIENDTKTQIPQPSPEREIPQTSQTEEIPTKIRWMDWSGPVAVELPGPPAELQQGAPAEARPRGTEQPVADPLPAAPPPEPTLTWAQVERAPLWRRVLTGDPDTVPDDIRHAAGADAAGDSPEEQEYRLLNTVNRSWAVDHLGMSREQVRAEWPTVRRDMAQQMGVADSEHEVFTELSLREQSEPLREKVRQTYMEAYLEALDSEPPQPDSPSAHREDESEEPWQSKLRAMAEEHAEKDREECMPYMDSLLQTMQAFADAEAGVTGQMRVLWQAPELLEAVDAIAELDDSKRSVLYRMLRPELQRRGVEPQALGVWEAMYRNWMRGGVNTGYNVVQGLGNMVVAQLDNLADVLDSDSVRKFSDRQDKRLRVIEELRNVAQQEVVPIRLEEDSNFFEQLLVDASGGVSEASLAFAGPLGLSLLAVSSAGQSVATARQRAPRGDRRMQMAAGCLAGGVQAAVFKGMTVLGQRMFGRVMRAFATSVGSGTSGYMASLAKSAYWFTQENVNLLLASKGAQLSEMGLQELAALASDTASNIDWEGFGDNLLDLELNMREAAANLPFILIAGGRAAWHHFRHPRTILGEGRILDDWGVDAATRERIMNAPDIRTQGMLLELGLRNSKRWSMIPEDFVNAFIGRCLRLLHVDDMKLFDNEHNVRTFLQLPPITRQVTSLVETLHPPKPLPSPQEQVQLHPHFKRTRPIDEEKYLRLVQMMYDWYRKSGLAYEQYPPARTSISQLVSVLPSTRVTPLPIDLQQNGFYSPGAERKRRGYLADCLIELEQLSYRFLLNAHTLDKLVRVNRSHEALADMLETSRRKYLRMVAHETMRGLVLRDYSRLSDRITAFFHQYYEGQRVRLNREPWIMDVPFSVFRDLNLPKTLNRVKLRHLPFELTEQVKISRATEALVKKFNEILPHLEDFQEFIATGHSPRRSYELLLQHELGEDILEGHYRDDPALAPRADEKASKRERLAYSKRNQERFQVFSRLSGLELEKATTPEGAEIWRGVRPDGWVSRWKDSREEAINILSYDYVRRNSVPYGANQYGTFVSRNSMLDGITFMKELCGTRRGYSGDEALSIKALDDMLKLWMTDASLMPLGLEMGPGLRYIYVPKSYHGVEGVVYQRRGTGLDHHVLDLSRNASPLNLIMSRARVYWRRMMNSDWVKASDVADFLLEHGEISPEKAKRLLDRGRPFRNYLKRSTLNKMGPRKRVKYRIYRAMNRYLVDKEAMVNGLSEFMARMSGMVFLANMNRLPLPVTLREWVAAAAFREGLKFHHRPGQLAAKFVDQRRAKKDSVSMVRWYNERAADFLQEKAEKIAELRRQSADAESPLVKSPIYRLMMEMWQPDPEQRKEQCWSYLLCGETAFRNLDQRFWNILRFPERGWALMDSKTKEKMCADFEEVCRQYPVPGADGGENSDFEACLRNLQQVLQQYPQIRDYSTSVRDPEQLMRLHLDAPPSLRPVMDYSESDSSRISLATPPAEQPGGRYEITELPPELAADPRVMPAVQLLSALRVYSTAMPVVKADGIWWRDRRYGGVDGARPSGIPDEWTVEKPLEGFLSFLSRIAEQYEGKPMVHAGLKIAPLEGFFPDDVFLNMTVYRSNEHPEVQARLMPGSIMAQRVPRRSPYVVYSIGGVPLPEEGVWRPAKGDALMYRNLVSFSCRPDRFIYFEHMLQGRKIMDYFLAELVYRCQDPDNLASGRHADMSNFELLLHIGQESNFSESLRHVQPGELVPTEALTAKLLRELLAYEFGDDPQSAETELMKMGKLLKENPSWVEAIRDMLREKGVNHAEMLHWDEIVRPRIRQLREAQEKPSEELPPSVENWETLRGLRLPVRTGSSPKSSADDDARDYIRKPVQHRRSESYDGER